MDIPHEKQFHFRDGTSIASLEQLKNKIESISYNEFYHHVNAEKNDFANWIRHVLHDEPLADDLQKVTSIVETVEIINDYLHPRPITEPRIDMQSKIETTILPTVEEKPKFPKTETYEKPGMHEKLDFNIVTQDESPDLFSKAKQESWPELPLPKEQHIPESAHIQKEPMFMQKEYVKEPVIDLPESVIPPQSAPSLSQTSQPSSMPHHDDESRLILKDFMYGLVFGLIIGVILGRILSF